MPGLWLGRLRQLTFVRNMDQTITITHDGTLDIATGRSRKEVSWHNKEVQWSALVKKISVPHRTAETHAEYMSMKKALQDERKDVGGFVGGYLTGGRRKTANVLHRQLVTLDIDFAKGDLWGDYTMLYCNAALLYSTHKHTGESPRLRLVIPLDRPVSREEYVAIARRMAGDLGINAFDDTTYEPARLMYWPSVSKDGEYVFEYQDGPWLSADAVLGSYKNWRDASEWPVSDRTVEVRLPESVREKYEEFEKQQILALEDQEEITAVNAAVLSNKLLQFSNGAIYGENHEFHEIHQAKLEALEEIVEAANGNPVLVFYSFKHDAERIKKRLKTYRPTELKGSAEIQAWNAGQIPVLLAHPASAGHGLNLQAGGNVIVWFGLNWSLELYQQANARLHRQGQTKPVIIHHLVAPGTMDEDVMASLSRKGESQDALMEAVKARIKKYKK